LHSDKAAVMLILLQGAQPAAHSSHNDKHVNRTQTRSDFPLPTLHAQ